MNQSRIISDVSVEVVIKGVFPVIAFCNIDFLDNHNKPVFRVRGYRIKVFDTVNKTPYFLVDAPAYRVGTKWWKSFIVDDAEFWREIESKIIKELQELNGGKTASDYINEAEASNIDLDEIDTAISKHQR